MKGNTARHAVGGQARRASAPALPVQSASRKPESRPTRRARNPAPFHAAPPTANGNGLGWHLLYTLYLYEPMGVRYGERRSRRGFAASQWEWPT